MVTAGVWLALITLMTWSYIQPLSYQADLKNLQMQYAGSDISSFASIISEQKSMRNENPGLYTQKKTVTTYDNSTNSAITVTLNVDNSLGRAQTDFMSMLQNLQKTDQTNKSQLGLKQAELNAAEPGTFQVRVLDKQINDLKNLPEAKVSPMVNVNRQPLFGFTETNGYYSFILMALVSIFIIFSLGSIYSHEYQTNINELLMTSKNGKRKTLFAKSAAAVILCIAVALPAQLIQMAFYIKFYGMDWTTPAVFFPFPCCSCVAMNIGQMFFILLALNLLGSVALGLSVMLISAVSRSSVLPIVSGFALWILPMFLMLLPSNGFTPWLIASSFIGAQIPYTLNLWFGQYMNLFGFAVPQLPVVGIFAAVFVIVSAVFTPWLFRLKNSI